MNIVVAALLAAPVLATAQPAEPQPDELLQIVFPKWADEEGGRVQSIATGAVTRGWDTRQGRKRNVIVVPRQVVRVGPDRLVLLAALTPADDGGAPLVAHGTPVGLAAYVFKPGKDGWKVARRQEPFDLQGYEGEVQMDVVPLSAKAKALNVNWGSCWQGYCVDWFALYAIGVDGVKAPPLVLQKIKGGNIYSRDDCAERLGSIIPGMAQPQRHDDQAPPAECYAIEGRWEIAGAGVAKGAVPGPLTLRFTGAMSKADKHGSLPAQRVEQSMKFEFRGGRYVPVAGSNPIPDA